MEISRLTWNRYILLVGILSVVNLSTGRPQQQPESPLKRDNPVLPDSKSPQISAQNDNRYMKDVKNPHVVITSTTVSNLRRKLFGHREIGSNAYRHRQILTRNNNRSRSDKNRNTVIAMTVSETPLEIVGPVPNEDRAIKGVSDVTDGLINYGDLIDEPIRRSGRKVIYGRNHIGNEKRRYNDTFQPLYDATDKKLFSNFLKHAVNDLKTETKYIPIETQGGEWRIGEQKNWPNAPIMTQNEYESYENYTQISEIDPPNDRHDIQHYAISTSPKKPVIHQVVTKWSDTPSYDGIDALHTAPPSSAMNDVVTFNGFNDGESAFKPTEPYPQNILSSSSSVEPYVDFYSNGHDVDTSKIDDGQTVYIRPKPSYITNSNYNNNGDSLYFNPTPRPSLNTQDLFNRPKPVQNQPNTNVILMHSPTTIVLSTKPNVVTPMYPTTQNSVGYDQNRPDDDGVYFPSGKPVAPLSDADDGCPLVYITVNNSVENKAKEGCADIHLIINSNVINKNEIVTPPPPSFADGGSNSYPIVPVAADIPEYDPVEEDVPVIEGVNSVVPIVPVNVPQSAEPVASATNSIGNTALSPASGGALGAPPLFGSGGGGSGGSKPTSDDDEDDGGGLMGWISTTMDTFAWLSLMNPFNYGIFSFILAPLVIFAAGGAGLASLLSWALPAGLERNYREGEEDIMNKWEWNEDYNTWNWAAYPNRRKDWMQNNEIDNSVQTSPSYSIKDILYNAYDSIRKWLYDKYSKFTIIRMNFIQSRKINESRKEKWKKRRK